MIFIILAFSNGGTHFLVDHLFRVTHGFNHCADEHVNWTSAGGAEGVVAELSGMRFPRSSTGFYHHPDSYGLETRPFPYPISAATPSKVVDLAGSAKIPETFIICKYSEVYEYLGRAGTGSRARK